MRLTPPRLPHPGPTANTPGRCRSGTARRVRSWVGRCLLITALAVVVCLALTSAAHADPVQQVALVKSVNTVFTNIRNWVMGILAGFATVLLTIGGVRYLAAGGDPGEVEKAKTAFKSAGIGYILAALAPLVVEILKGIVGQH